MARLVEFPSAGGNVLVEVDEVGGVVPVSAAGDIAVRAQQSFEEALTSLRPAIEAFAGQLRSMGEIDEAKIELGLKLGIESGFIIAKGTGEANVVLTLAWRRAAPA